jgi:hypothetical protein
VLQPHVESIVRITDQRAEQGDDSVRDGAVSAMLTLAALQGTIIKNPAFSEECEWRAVVPYLGPLSPIHLTRVRRGRIGLVPYCELRANGESSQPSLPLTEIVVGPRFDGLQLNAFITYLAVNGYKAAPWASARRPLAGFRLRDGSLPPRPGLWSAPLPCRCGVSLRQGPRRNSLSSYRTSLVPFHSAPMPGAPWPSVAALLRDHAAERQPFGGLEREIRGVGDFEGSRCSCLGWSRGRNSETEDAEEAEPR